MTIFDLGLALLVHSLLTIQIGVAMKKTILMALFMLTTNTAVSADLISNPNHDKVSATGDGQLSIELFDDRNAIIPATKTEQKGIMTVKLYLNLETMTGVADMAITHTHKTCTDMRKLGAVGKFFSNRDGIYPGLGLSNERYKGKLEEVDVETAFSFAFSEEQTNKDKYAKDIKKAMLLKFKHPKWGLKVSGIIFIHNNGEITFFNERAAFVNLPRAKCLVFDKGSIPTEHSISFGHSH